MNHPEHELQVAVANFLDLVLDERQVAWTMIAHGGIRLPIRTAVRLKQAGLKPGWPDVMLAPRNRCSCYIELKAPGKYPEPHQRALHERLRGLGCLVAVCRSVDEVEGVLSAWEIPRKGRLAA